MQPANDVKLGNRFGIAGSRSLKRLFERHCVSARRIFFAPESTETTRCYAHVCRIDMTVDVEVSLIAMHPFADVIGHPAYSQDVA